MFQRMLVISTKFLPGADLQVLETAIAEKIPGGVWGWDYEEGVMIHIPAEWDERDTLTRHLERHGLSRHGFLLLDRIYRTVRTTEWLRLDKDGTTPDDLQPSIRADDAMIADMLRGLPTFEW